MWSTAGPVPPQVSTANWFSACAPARPPNTASTGPSCGSPNRSRPSARDGPEMSAGDRPADDLVLRPVTTRNGIREEDAPRGRGRQPVGEPEVGVRLGQRRRDPADPRGEHHRPRHVPAAAEHDVRLAAREDPRARERRANRASDRAQEIDAERCEGNRRSRRRRARSRPQEPDATRRGRATRRTSPSPRARAAPPRLRAPVARVRRFRPPRSRTRASTTSPLTAMLRRIPTPARRTIKLDPPYETNGSGIPVSGAIPALRRG